ncbi:MAG: cytochrome c biogenesis protein ResB [Chloroflexota bacterium]
MAQSATPITKGAKSPIARATPGPDVAQEQKRRRRDPVEAIWALFCSVKFAVVTNVALAVAAMLGTLVPQMQPGIQDFEAELNAFLNEVNARYGPLTGLLHWAGFFDLYNSLWFRMLVVVVVFSIIVCTLNRWQPTMRLITRPTVRTTDSFLTGLTEKAQFRSVPLERDEAERVVAAALKKSRYRVLSEKSTDGSALYLYADRDRWSKLVTFVSHAALVMLILSGAGMTQLGWRERSVVFEPGVPVDVGHGLDFKVANVGFSIDYYPDGTTVKEYRNTLAVYEAGTQVLTKTIIVNDPLRYNGINYFLVSYQPVLFANATDAAGNQLQLRRMGATGPMTATTGTGEALLDFQFQSSDNLPMDLVQLPVKDHVLTLELTYYQDVARAEGENPPAYVRGFVDKDFEKPIYDAFLPRTGAFSLPGYEDYKFTFKKDTSTILEVALDPGLGLVGFFFFVMAAGFTISLYTTFTRCWAKIVPNEERPGTVNIMLGGMAEKNKVTFERDFEKLATRLKETLGAATAKGQK